MMEVGFNGVLAQRKHVICGCWLLRKGIPNCLQLGYDDSKRTPFIKIDMTKL